MRRFLTAVVLWPIQGPLSLPLSVSIISLVLSLLQVSEGIDDPLSRIVGAFIELVTATDSIFRDKRFSIDGGLSYKHCSKNLLLQWPS